MTRSILMRYKTLTLIGLLLCYGVGLRAQETFSFTGKILDATSSDPLPGAVIKVLDAQMSWTLTNDKGAFHMLLPKGTYLTRWSFPISASTR